MKYCLTPSAKYDLRRFFESFGGGLILLACIPVFMGMVVNFISMFSEKSPYDFANTFDTVVYYGGILGWTLFIPFLLWMLWDWAKYAIVKCEDLEDDDN